MQTIANATCSSKRLLARWSSAGLSRSTQCGPATDPAPLDLSSWRTVNLVAAALFAMACLAGAPRPGASPGLRPSAMSGQAGMPATSPCCAISGVVRSEAGPVQGATVRIQTTTTAATTNERGEFTIQWPGRKAQVALTASATGYFIAGPVQAEPGPAPVSIHLVAIPRQDNSEYQWVSPFSSAGNASNCQNCHSEPGGLSRLPFDEWVADAHGRSAQNARFISMYKGTDLSGRNQSPPTRFAVDKQYGRAALRPDAAKPYFGPGFQLDSPGEAGNCAACHTPGAAVRAPYGTRPDSLTGDPAAGITCDLCHKAINVRLDPASGKPYPNTPGVLSLEFRRPAAHEQIFFGPLDDVAPGHDVYSRLHRESQFCAPCHSGQFWGVQVYNSFGEWLDSSYSRGANARTCQDCHMPRRGNSYFARVDKGGRRRDPNTIFSHLMRGSTDAEFMKGAAQLEVETRLAGKALHVAVRVTNAAAGHALPTDHPARNILLVVRAQSASGAELPLLRGPVLPAWAGKGKDPQDFAGRPGRGFARILEELWTGLAPTAAYWNPTVERADTRIPAMQSDLSEYEFALTGAGTVRLNARLIYRRAFRDLAKTKGWQDPDLIMCEQSVTVKRGRRPMPEARVAACGSREEAVPARYHTAPGTAPSRRASLYAARLRITLSGRRARLRRHCGVAAPRSTARPPPVWARCR